jgi:lactate dehydrogenase-like 2-hydroxyacid dehydrogenase
MPDPDPAAARPRVALARRLPPAVEAELARHFELLLPAGVDRPLDRQELSAAMRSADAFVPSVADRVPAAAIDDPARRVRIIANFGAGTDNIDLAAARRAGILVTNTPGVLAEDTADVALYLMLAVMRQTHDAERELRAGAWTGWRPTHIFGRAIRGKTLGVVGYGRIGRALATRAAALGMRVIAARRPGIDVTVDARPLDDLLATSDVVSLHTPATAETHHLIDARRLALMPQHAILINTARGSIVDEAALVHALRSGIIAGAGLDVYEGEPRITPELLALPNVVLLPHIGSATRETRDAMGALVIANLVAFFAGTMPPNRIA